MTDVEAGEKPSIPEEYSESDCETQTVRNSGAIIWVVLGLCAVSWVFHAFPVMGTTDTPGFAKSLIWAYVFLTQTRVKCSFTTFLCVHQFLQVYSLFVPETLRRSIAHHTDAWQGAMASYPPPPPSFGDGADNFPDARL